MEQLEQFGHQRDWTWRGWQIRYTYFRPSMITIAPKTPLLFIHGFGASLRHWRYNLSVFAQEYPVYAIDLLGFGASRKVNTEYNVQLWSDLIYDFWHNFIETPMIIVANSLGSLVTVVTSYQHPEIVKKIVLLNLPDVAIRQKMIPKLVQPLVKIIENLFANSLVLTPLFLFLRQPSVLKKWLSLAYIDQTKVDEELLDIIAIPPQDQDAVTAFISLCKNSNHPSFAPAMTEILSQLKLPIVLIWGQKDKFIPISLAKIFSQCNQEIELIEIENVGHCPHDEIPEQFNQILLHRLP